MCTSGFLCNDPGVVAEFWGDVKKALHAWRAAPAFVLLALAFHLPFWFSPFYEWASFLGALLYITYVGFVGTERLWYLSSWNERTLGPRNIWQATWAYWPRFAGLGILSTVAYILLTVPFSGVGYFFGDRPLLEETIVRGLSVLVVDVALTFMTPALAYSANDTYSGMTLGWVFLKEQGRGVILYALAPPLVMLGLLQRTPNEFLSPAAHVLLALIATLLYLLLKGATAAKYLRHHEVSAEPALSHVKGFAPTPVP